MKSSKLSPLTMIPLMVLTLALPAAFLSAQSPEPPEFPKLEDVTKDFEKITETSRNEPGLFTLWVNNKEGRMLATMPAGYESKRFFIAMTVASGEDFAGLQAGDLYVYWKRYDKRLALIQPNVLIRSKGDKESQDSVERLYTDRVILDVPIMTLDGGRPVIDLTGLLVGRATEFFGPSMRISNPALVSIKKAKTFPENIEVAFEVPTASAGNSSAAYFGNAAPTDGKLKTLHYSISVIPNNPGYQPRQADDRVGYFVTHYYDYGDFKDKETVKRFINRWQLEKADPSLELSPPKKPIIFFIEHTTPIRYRRWVREGILAWNKAFEKIGIADAIEVYYQDSQTGAHMDKDPEDVRWNFIRWLNNNYGLAIGPSRVNPLTGQILDADIILTDGWIRHFRFQYQKLIPDLAMEGFSPETYTWLANYSDWDPRVRMALPVERTRISEQIQHLSEKGFGGHPAFNFDAHLIGDDAFDGLAGRVSQVNGMCMATEFEALNLALTRMYLDTLPKDGDGGDPNTPEKSPGKPEKKESEIDGVPESIIGPMIAHLVSHEVGHTLGLRHNFKASSLYTLEEINSPEMKNKPYASSVMDYLPANINMNKDFHQGNYSMVGIGPYDMWAIQYGYTFDNKLDPILARSAEPQLDYGTDEDTWGPDPYARRYDFSKNPLEYARNQMELARYHRQRIIEKFVEKGDSWTETRKGYEMTLSLQVQSLSMMSNWIGGSFIHRQHKGDDTPRKPIEEVPAKDQREALNFIIKNTFYDDAYGLTPELLQYMTAAKWWDDPYSLFAEPVWPVHDYIMGIQASALTMLMNPTTLRRVYDNEYLAPADQDVVTLPELLDTLTASIWSELDEPKARQYTAREPMISSLRRNLQREYINRLITLCLLNRDYSAAYKPIINLAHMQLRDIKTNKIEKALRSVGERLDPYTKAHLIDTSERIEKALDAQYLQM